MPLLTTEERLGRTVLGKYRIERVLGQGGMGVVYAGTHLRLGRGVAVKFLHPQFSQSSDAIERFSREAEAAAKLAHPNVVDVRDIDTDDDGSVFMVLELLQGETLASVLERRGTLSVEEALAVLDPVMDAVASAHEAGIVHRDLKPDNIFLSATRRGGTVPKVLDFGVAKLHGAGGTSTVTGTVVGTPVYMSPEQAMGKGKDVGPWSDVWSMGVVLYECLTGLYPFDLDPQDAPTATLVTIVTTAPIAITARKPDVPPWLAAITMRALGRAPSPGGGADARYRNMREMRDAMRAAAPAEMISPASIPPPAFARLSADSGETSLPGSPSPNAIPMAGTGTVATPAAQPAPATATLTPFASIGPARNVEPAPRRSSPLVWIAAIGGIGVVVVGAAIGAAVAMSGSSGATQTGATSSGTETTSALPSTSAATTPAAPSTVLTPSVTPAPAPPGGPSTATTPTTTTTTTTTPTATATQATATDDAGPGATPATNAVTTERERRNGRRPRAGRVGLGDF